MQHEGKPNTRRSTTGYPTNGEGTYADRLTLDATTLSISVDDVGRLRFPLSPGKARALADKGQPAPFGLGTETHFDKTVRDVAEIPAAQVHIDTDAWNAALTPALDQMRESLGLAPGRLSAKLDKLLVYSPGQFFKPHQDSERSDTMIGTLVVVLPSAHQGGTLIIEHGSQRRRLLSAHVKPTQLVLFGFYADCRHEIRPVTEGYRVVLSHELHYETAWKYDVAERYPDSDCDDEEGDGEASEQEAELDLERQTLVKILMHFFDPDRLEVLSAYDRPEKLVCLLDHQYSQRSLGWHRLKGPDNTWGTLLRDVATGMGYRVFLTLADVRDTWDAQEPQRPRWQRRGRHRYYTDDELDNDRDQNHVSLEASADVELGELIDRGAQLTDFRDSANRPFDLKSLSATDAELHHRDGIESFQPDSEEYEGWMGNSGNTLERQYHRAAVVLWPAANHYRILLRSSPATLVQELARDALSDPAAVTEPFHAIGDAWPPRMLIEDDSALETALRMATGVDNAAFSLNLLKGFRLRVFTGKRLAALIALGDRHGAAFCRELVDQWTTEDPEQIRNRHETERSFERMPWVRELGRFHRKAADSKTQAWSAQSERLGSYFITATHRMQQSADQLSPSARRRDLKNGERRWALLIDAIVQIDAETTNAKLAETLVQTLDTVLPELALSIARNLLQPAATVLGEQRLTALLAQIEASLAHRESLHVRLAGDWRLSFATSCTCDDCTTLATFLEDSEAQALDWPLAKARRQHIHRKIDHAELPVSHRTRRQGSPQVLELRKLHRLFKDDARELTRLDKLREKLAELLLSR